MPSQEQKVYGDTTQPLPRRAAGDGVYYNRKDKSDLGENFVAPDGGWAWLVCIAAGISNVGKIKTPIQCQAIIHGPMPSL